MIDLTRKIWLALPWQVYAVLVNLPRRACVAGGFIRSVYLDETPNDIDICVDSMDTAARAIAILGDYPITMESRNAVTFDIDGVVVQVVHRWLFSPEEHIKRFDFTIAQACFWIDAVIDDSLGTTYVPRLAMAPTFLEDIDQRKLVYTAPDRLEEPLGSLARALKFEGRGYHLSAANLAKLTQRTVQRLQEQEAALMDDIQSPHTLTRLNQLAWRAGRGSA